MRYEYGHLQAYSEGAALAEPLAERGISGWDISLCETAPTVVNRSVWN
jgi:hypothetical protein